MSSFVAFVLIFSIRSTKRKLCLVSDTVLVPRGSKACVLPSRNIARLRTTKGKLNSSLRNYHFLFLELTD